MFATVTINTPEQRHWSCSYTPFAFLSFCEFKNQPTTRVYLLKFSNTETRAERKILTVKTPERGC